MISPIVLHFQTPCVRHQSIECRCTRLSRNGREYIRSATKPPGPLENPCPVAAFIVCRCVTTCWYCLQYRHVPQNPSKYDGGSRVTTTAAAEQIHRRQPCQRLKGEHLLHYDMIPGGTIFETREKRLPDRAFGRLHQELNIIARHTISRATGEHTALPCSSAHLTIIHTAPRQQNGGTGSLQDARAPVFTTAVGNHKIKQNENGSCQLVVDYVSTCH